MKGSQLIILVAAAWLAGGVDSAVLPRRPAPPARELRPSHGSKQGRAAQSKSEKNGKLRRLQTTEKAQGKEKWVHDPQGVKKLEKYAITSLMTMISLKIAQDIDAKTANESQKAQARKLGAIGQFVRGKSIEESWSKQKKDLRGYLRKHRVSVRRGIGLSEMARITRKYMLDRFGIPGRKFEVVRDLIGGIYRVTQKRTKKVKL